LAEVIKEFIAGRRRSNIDIVNVRNAEEILMQFRNITRQVGCVYLRVCVCERMLRWVVIYVFMRLISHFRPKLMLIKN
jgi:hypothetical protein